MSPGAGVSFFGQAQRVLMFFSPSKSGSVSSINLATADPLVMVIRLTVE